LVEDVSRHNAFDKVVGQALLDNYDFSSVFVAVSGRITQDMVVNAGNVGIPIVASRSTVIEPARLLAEGILHTERPLSEKEGILKELFGIPIEEGQLNLTEISASYVSFLFIIFCELKFFMILHNE
jgi:hypothetical protein